MTSRSILTTILMSIAIVSAVSACGRKGPLEPPPASVTVDARRAEEPKNRQLRPTSVSYSTH